ncbi:MAG: TrmB family transcriptional regulator [Symploca sp. SIO2D2]|nr:TrmB family transcriptional regulator [Symploca sp. SIO2D2]
MQNFPAERPFDNFRVAITDPSHFFGRSELIDTVSKSPFQVRILLAGRRMGKTSTLRAVEWNLFNPKSSYVRRAFPVLINLQVEQPKDLDHLRYLLIARLREAIEGWKEVPLAEMRKMYREFLSQVKGGEVTFKFLEQFDIKLNLTNPDSERRLNNDSFRLAFLKTLEELRNLNFHGVCFLIDGAEFIVRQRWATDAWSYLRGLKDTDTAIKPFLGLLLSGYRDLKEYQQRVGSPLLNIAEIEWLAPLSNEDTKKLIADRAEQEQVPLSEERIASVIEWLGCHPYLTQQSLNFIFDCHHQGDSRSNLIDKMLQHHDNDFWAWWNEEQHSGCFSETERKVYRALVQHRTGDTKSLAKYTSLSRGKVAEALEVIAGTGVIQQLDDESYAISCRLFEKWVAQQTS